MKRAFWIPVVFTALMWIIHLLREIYHIDPMIFAIHPRDLNSLAGIFFSPLVHGSWEHLLSNTVPILLLGVLVFVIYDKIATRVWILNYILTGTLVWLFARDSYHIGASGIIYGLASFLLFSGFFRMDIRAIAIASGVAIFYGGLVWGILPIQPGVSWESHLSGGIVGLILAFLFRNKHKDVVVEEHENEKRERKTFDDYLDSR